MDNPPEDSKAGTSKALVRRGNIEILVKACIDRIPEPRSPHNPEVIKIKFTNWFKRIEEVSPDVKSN